VVAEEIGHPVGVGIGALGAGAAGAAIGAVGGPIGILVGAVIGAVAGGFVGEEVASAGEEAVTDNPDSSYTEPDLGRPSSFTAGSPSFSLPSDTTSGSLYSGADNNTRQSVDTTPDIPAIPSVEAANARFETGEQPADVTPDPAFALGGGVSGAASAGEESDSGYSEDAIRTRAYYHHLDRVAAGREGDEYGDWYEAERKARGG
jgi:hypothetical protein